MLSPDRITAGELRATGYDVPLSIPDCGHISRASIRVDIVADSALGSGGMIGVSFSTTFTEPFEWIEASVTVDRSAP